MVEKLKLSEESAAKVKTVVDDFNKESSAYLREAFGGGFLNPVDPFLERFERVARLDRPELDSDNLTDDDAVLVPAVPARE